MFGVRPECKECQRINRKTYYTSNSYLIKERQRIYYQENKEKILEKESKRQLENKEIISLKRKFYNSTNKEIISIRNKKAYRDKKYNGQEGPGGGNWGSRTQSHIPLVLNEIERKLVIGSLLGDGSLRIANRSINPTFNEKHSIKQDKYLLWKADILSRFEPRIYRYSNIRKNKEHHGIQLRTLSSPAFLDLYKDFYNNSKKNVPQHIIDEIDPFILSIWLQDDGSCVNNKPNSRNRNPSFYISTLGFPLDTQLMLQDKLQNMFNSNTISLYKSEAGMGYYLYLRVEATEAMAKICAPYWHHIFSYKFPYPELLVDIEP